MDSSELASLVRKIATDKKGSDIVVMDVRELTTVTDYFVVITADNRKHAQAIADEIVEKVPDGVVHHLEGYENSRWILIDMGMVIANVMLPEERAYYDLERLWGAASV